MSSIPKNTSKGLSRRDFLKVAGAGALVLGGCSPLASKDPRERSNGTSTSSRAKKYALTAAPMSFVLS